LVSLAGLFFHKAPLRCFLTLRHFKARLKEPSSTNTLPPFSGLLIELSRFPAENVLESVTVIISVVRDSKLDLIRTDVHSLVAFFGQRSFPALQEVNLELNFHGSHFYYKRLMPDSVPTFSPEYLADPTTWNLDRYDLGFRFNFDVRV